jgi:hypothetical protein
MIVDLASLFQYIISLIPKIIEAFKTIRSTFAKSNTQLTKFLELYILSISISPCLIKKSNLLLRC